MLDPRILELQHLAQEEGITLPYDPKVITAIEDAGGVVDLMTGAVFPLDTESPFLLDLACVPSLLQDAIPPLEAVSLQG